MPPSSQTNHSPVCCYHHCMQIGMRFFSNMKMDTAQNMGVVVALLIWLRNQYFGKKLKSIDFKSYTDDEKVEELDSPEGIFAECKQLKKENRLMNGLAGGLLKIVHTYNLLQCARFLIKPFTVCLSDIQLGESGIHILLREKSRVTFTVKPNLQRISVLINKFQQFSPHCNELMIYLFLIISVL